jgi:hypothetical protein
MPLSWNEIRSRSIAFSKEWETAFSEDAEAKTFWDDFFNISGTSRRFVASFERPVKRLDESTGYIDLLWKGTLMVEHKSRGRTLDKALIQVKEYFQMLQEYELAPCSNEIGYSNYPWPENPTDKQKESIEKVAQKVLDARAEFPNSSLADLYDPLTMPPPHHAPVTRQGPSGTRQSH